MPFFGVSGARFIFLNEARLGLREMAMVLLEVEVLLGFDGVVGRRPPQPILQMKKAAVLSGFFYLWDRCAGPDLK